MDNNTSLQQNDEHSVVPSPFAVMPQVASTDSIFYLALNNQNDSTVNLLHYQNDHDEPIAQTQTNVRVYSEHDKEIIRQAKNLVSHKYFILLEELYLLKRQIFEICIVAIILVYGIIVVALNLAFYRYEYAGPDRLKDFGFELIPKFFHNADIADIPVSITIFMIAIIAFGRYIYCFLVLRDVYWFSSVDNLLTNRPPFAVNIVKRIQNIFCIGHIMRATCYLSTTLPGGNDGCLHEEFIELHRPKNLKEIFTTTGSLPSNCGDLMFSGHMLFVLLGTLSALLYAPKIKFKQKHWYNKFLRNPIFLFGIILCVIEIILLIGSRRHYSSDIIVSIYLVPMTFYCYNSLIQPYDLAPNYISIANYIIKNHKPSNSA